MGYNPCLAVFEIEENSVSREKAMSPFYIALLIITTILAMALIALVLLHSPKGEGMGGIGGSATLFTGKRGAEAGIDRVTWTIAFLFLLSCTVIGFGFIR